MKRFIDICIAIVGISLLLPVFISVGLMVWIKLGSPILFKQQRAGLKGKPFYLYKFRTMTYEKGEDGELLPDSQRLKAAGQWIREKSLDELPQLINVLKGDLSLVGPRPLLMEYLDLYTPSQARRHEVMPGITGWAQINGRNSISWEEKFQFDVWYVDHQSIWLDLKILFITLLKVIKSEGINQKGHVSMDKFQGLSKDNASKGDAM